MQTYSCECLVHVSRLKCSNTTSCCSSYFTLVHGYYNLGLPWQLSGKESPSNAGDVGLIPGWVRSPGVGNGNPFQYSCLGNAMDRGAQWAPWDPWDQRIRQDLATEEQQSLNRNMYQGNSLVIQWLRLPASNAGDVGLICSWETSIPYASPCGQKETKQSVQTNMYLNIFFFLQQTVLEHF